MKAILIAVAVALMAAGCARERVSGTGGPASGSQALTGGTVNREDSSFAREACQTGAAETELGKLAAQNTKNKAVRSFAKSLAEDHARAEKELAQLFSRKGIPAEKELADSLQNSLERLAALKGGEFDQAFKQQVIEDHEKAIALFEKQAERGTDPDLKAFAQKHLPHLREHLAQARQLPVSSDTEGPPPDSVNTILQNPASRINVPR
jgi:putative membrane protein